MAFLMADAFPGYQRIAASPAIRPIYGQLALWETYKTKQECLNDGQPFSKIQMKTGIVKPLAIDRIHKTAAVPIAVNLFTRMGAEISRLVVSIYPPLWVI
jgi:hypothetical protein